MAYTRTVDDADDVETGFVCIRCEDVPGVYGPRSPEDWAALGLPVPDVFYPQTSKHGLFVSWSGYNAKVAIDSGNAGATLLEKLGWRLSK
jgi:hypothetical protein